MIENNRIVLSFVDSSITVRNFDRRSVASILSGFKFTQLDKKFEDLGFETLPGFVGEILYNNGYRKDYNLNMWVIKTSGSSTCSPDDEYNETTGYRLSVMRSKKAAYDKAFSTIAEIFTVFFDGYNVLENTILNLSKFSKDEGEAIGRVIETGKSDPQ
ncbi:MAG: hypothetical protein NC548_25950 [Lachnospiraceae bacterium]|nr:hypothetical protein [Lachnospiraceae bacterium]